MRVSIFFHQYMIKIMISRRFVLTHVVMDIAFVSSKIASNPVEFENLRFQHQRQVIFGSDVSFSVLALYTISSISNIRYNHHCQPHGLMFSFNLDFAALQSSSNHSFTVNVHVRLLFLNFNTLKAACSIKALNLFPTSLGVMSWVTVSHKKLFRMDLAVGVTK